jgi:hypothetical protein
MAESPMKGSGAAAAPAKSAPAPGDELKKGRDPWWMQRLVADVIIFLDRIRRRIARMLGLHPVPSPVCIGREIMSAAALSDTEMNVSKPIRVKPYKADNAMDGAGGYGTIVAFLQQPRELIEETLPAELTIHSPHNDSAHDASPTHPLVLTFGEQCAVRAYSNPVYMGLQYLESVTIIPRVYLRREAAMRQFGQIIEAGAGTYFGPFNYMPRLYLDQLLPTIVGWSLAYRKVWGRIEHTVDSLQASSLLTGSPHYKAQFTRGQYQPKVAVDYPALAPWLKMLNAPIVSRTPLGKFLFTKYFWAWKYASLWDVDLKLEVTNSGVRALPAGRYSFETVSAPHAGEDGQNFAFIGALGWRLLLPFAREILHAGDGESFPE